MFSFAIGKMLSCPTWKLDQNTPQSLTTYQGIMRHVFELQTISLALAAYKYFVLTSTIRWQKIWLWLLIASLGSNYNQFSRACSVSMQGNKCSLISRGPLRLSPPQDKAHTISTWKLNRIGLLILLSWKPVQVSNAGMIGLGRTMEKPNLHWQSCTITGIKRLSK